MSENNGYSRDTEVRFWAWVQKSGHGSWCNLGQGHPGCPGDTRTHCKWWGACWVSGKKTGNIHAQRTQANVLEELEVRVKSYKWNAHCHSWELCGTPQNLTFPQTYVAASLQRNGPFCASSFCSRTFRHSPTPGSQLLGDLMGMRGSSPCSFHPEILSSLGSASSLHFLRTFPLHTVWL